DWSKVQFGLGENASDIAVADAEVLPQSAACGQERSNLFQRHCAGYLQARLAGFVESGVAQGAHQVVFMCPRLLLQLLNTLGRMLFGLQLLPFNQVVVPVQLFAQIADRSEERRVGKEEMLW